MALDRGEGPPDWGRARLFLRGARPWRVAAPINSRRAWEGHRPGTQRRGGRPREPVSKVSKRLMGWWPASFRQASGRPDG